MWTFKIITFLLQISMKNLIDCAGNSFLVFFLLFGFLLHQISILIKLYQRNKASFLLLEKRWLLKKITGLLQP